MSREIEDFSNEYPKNGWIREKQIFRKIRLYQITPIHYGVGFLPRLHIMELDGAIPIIENGLFICFKEDFSVGENNE